MITAMWRARVYGLSSVTSPDRTFCQKFRNNGPAVCWVLLSDDVRSITTVVYNQETENALDLT